MAAKLNLNLSFQRPECRTEFEPERSAPGGSLATPSKS